jgi:solute carrier family 45 protein 1/2/4
MARQNGMGNIMGMLAGGLDLPKLLPFLGTTQFKVLCAVASFVMFVTVTINCASIPERDPTLDDQPPEGKERLFNFFKGLYRAVVRLPPQIIRVCEVQFVAWIGYGCQPP